MDTMAPTEHLMARLRRERNNMTLETLASIVGVSASALSQWETGETKVPRRHHVEAADRALGADGQLLAAFGYGVKQPDGARMAELVAEAALQLEGLRTQLRTQADRLAALERRIERLER